MAAPSKMRSIEVLQAFRKGIAIRNSKVDDEVKVFMNPFSGTIDCENCQFRSLATTGAQLETLVRFIRCSFESLDFYATYFAGGLIMEQCTIDNELTFQSGGHNKHPIMISDTTFNSFVDFEDCWFTGPIRLQNVRFAMGTNLLGNEHTPLAVRFDVPPDLEDVRGELRKDTYQTGPR